MNSHLLDHRFLNIPLSALAFSLAIHFGVVLMVALSPIFESLGLSIFPKKKMDEIYQGFIQVDVVALPDMLPNEKSSIDTALPIVDKPEKSKEENVDTLKKDDLALFEEAKKAEDVKKKAETEAKHKALEKKKLADQEKALKRLQEEAKREAALKSLQNKSGKAGRGKLAGNVLSKGNSLTGAVGTAKDQYGGRVLEAIKQNFNIYFWQQKKGLSAVIHLELFPTGKVRSREIVKRSSDPTYDSAVLQAIDAAYFPAPEEPSVVEGGFDITFIPN
jgi:TolA protein